MARIELVGQDRHFPARASAVGLVSKDCSRVEPSRAGAVIRTRWRRRGYVAHLAAGEQQDGQEALHFLAPKLRSRRYNGCMAKSYTPRSLTPMQRLLHKTEKTENCWFWRGLIHPKGYGYITVHGRYLKVHRLSWEENYGDPGKKWVLHKCDVRNCINPDHLFLGDNDANVADKVSKGRQYSILSEEDVRKIRIRYVKGYPKKPGNSSALALEFNVNAATIRDLVAFRTWKAVLPTS